MRKKLMVGLTIVGFFLIVSSLMISPVKAQSYSFEVDSMQSDVYIEKDGSITIEYVIDFTCDTWAHEIDVVDIGFPNEHYDLESVEASLDGNAIPSEDIQRSEVIDIGVEIWLREHSIQPGESGQLYVKGNNPKMIYEDSQNNTLASVKFSPTWFDSDFCDEYEYLEVNMHFPDGLTEEYGNEVKYHDEKFDEYSEDENGNLVYTWKGENLPMKQYTYGVSFPKRYVDTYQAWSSNPEVLESVVIILTVISIVALIGGGIFFLYRYKKSYSKRYYPPEPKTSPQDMAGGICGVGFCGGFFLLIFWAIFGDIFSIILFFVLCIAGFGVIGYFIYRTIGKRLKKLPYNKPQIKVDSAGVNTHLSVVEAAIIQNKPLDKVVFLIMFALIKRGNKIGRAHV